MLSITQGLYSVEVTRLLIAWLMDLVAISNIELVTVYLLCWWVLRPFSGLLTKTNTKPRIEISFYLMCSSYIYRIQEGLCVTSWLNSSRT